MRASKSPFQSYKSKRILSSANLIFSSASVPKVLKKRVCVLLDSVTVKGMERFRNSIRKMWSVCTKIALIEKIFRRKKFRRQVFVVYVLVYPLSKFGGNRTNCLWVLVPYSVRFKWKNWFEKRALNMSIRRIILFTSG